MTRDHDKPAVDVGLLRALAERVAVASGVAVVGVEWIGGHLLRVTIDRPEAGGVGIEDCVRVSRDLSTLLDVEDPIAHRYELEVTSPGIDRPLASPADYARAVGKTAKLKLYAPESDGQRVLRGEIVAAGPTEVRMLVDGKLHEVALANVREARIVFEVGGGARGGRAENARRAAARPKGRQRTPRQQAR
jgi:ribosome maturation factor RimP